MDQLDAIVEGGQRLGREGQRLGIAVEPDDPCRARGEHRPRVPAQADRAVHEHAAARHGQQIDGLGHEDGFVKRHQIPNSASARASSSVNGSRCSFDVNRSWFQTSR